MFTLWPQLIFDLAEMMNIKIYVVALSAIFVINSTKTFALTSEVLHKPDTLIADTNKLWFNKSNLFLIGTGMEFRDFDIVFKNTTENLVGSLGLDIQNEDFKYNATDWSFSPTINQTNASVFAITKYFSVAFTKAVKPNKNQNKTEVTSFNFSFPYKLFSFSFDYLKFTGLTRTEPVYKKTEYFKEMNYNPLSVTVMVTFGRLKNSFLYVPKKGAYCGSLLVRGLKLTIDNPSDFIPALTYKDDNPNDSIIQIRNVYVNKFTSMGALFAIKGDFILPLLKSKSQFKPNVLYIKGSFYTGLNLQNYEYHILQDTFSSVSAQIAESKGFGETRITNIQGSLVYDFSAALFGISTVFNHQSYGNSSIESKEGDVSRFDNNVSDTRIYYNVFFCYRLKTQKLVGKIDDFKYNVFH